MNAHEMPKDEFYKYLMELGRQDKEKYGTSQSSAPPSKSSKPSKSKRREHSM